MAHRDCRISVFGDIQNTAGDSCEQAALTDPDKSSGTDLDSLQKFQLPQSGSNSVFSKDYLLSHVFKK